MEGDPPVGHGGHDGIPFNPLMDKETESRKIKWLYKVNI